MLLVKKEPDWETGVSAAAAREGLYADHLVKDELVLGPELLQPPDVVYTIQALCNGTSSMRSVVRPCSVALNRLAELDISYTREETPQSTASPRLTEPELAAGLADSATATHPAVSSFNKTENTKRVPTVKPCSVTLERIPEDKLDVSSNKADTSTVTCSVRLERMAVDIEQGICRLGHKTYQLCDRAFGKNIHLKEPTLMDIKKEVGRQDKVAKNKVATKPALESFDDAKGELPGTLKASVLDIKAEKEAIPDHDSPGHKKTNLSIIHDYMCDNCGERFKNKSRLEIHILNFLLGYSCGEEIGRKRFKCSCGYQTDKKSTFQVHQKRHRGEKPYECSYCSYACDDKHVLMVHETTHTKEIRFKCGHCNYKTYNKRNLATHMTRHTIGKRFKCSRCDYVTQYKSALNAHQLTHTSEKPYKCNRCDFKCKQRSYLRSHERRHTGYKPFECDFCEYKCGDRERLKRHERKHTGEKPFECSFCVFKCSAKKHLIVHERIHTGEKPFKCRYCDYACNQKPNLVAHERVHTGEKPFKCEFCRYCATQKPHLTAHLRIHTGEKPFKCEDCDFKCKATYTLKRHQLIHSGEKPYKCTICDYKCRKKASLRLHQRVHSGKKPYQCKNSMNHLQKKHGSENSLK